jgi:hypothetical protein
MAQLDTVLRYRAYAVVRSQHDGTIDIYSAGCALCADTIHMVQRLAGGRETGGLLLRPWS